MRVLSKVLYGVLAVLLLCPLLAVAVDEGSTSQVSSAQISDASESTLQARPSQGHRDSSVLRLGIPLEPPNLDPTTGAAAAVDEVVYGNIFEGLTRISESGAVMPALAESWDVAADGMSYVFHLRHGVQFHDGSEFDAQDVKFSLQRAIAPDSSNAQKALLEPISRVEVIDQ